MCCSIHDRYSQQILGKITWSMALGGKQTSMLNAFRHNKLLGQCAQGTLLSTWRRTFHSLRFAVSCISFPPYSNCPIIHPVLIQKNPTAHFLLWCRIFLGTFVDIASCKFKSSKEKKMRSPVRAAEDIVKQNGPSSS